MRHDSLILAETARYGALSVYADRSERLAAKPSYSRLHSSKMLSRILDCYDELCSFSSRHKKSRNQTLRHDSLILAETARYGALSVYADRSERLAAKPSYSRLHSSKMLSRILDCYDELCSFSSRHKKSRNQTLRHDSLILAETARFELAGDCSLTDFEQKAVSTAPPLSVPEMCNMSTHSARK